MVIILCSIHIVDRLFEIMCRNWRITCKLQKEDFKNSRQANLALGKFDILKLDHI